MRNVWPAREPGNQQINIQKIKAISSIKLISQQADCYYRFFYKFFLFILNLLATNVDEQTA